MEILMASPERNPTNPLSHVDQNGFAHMVDVGEKPVSQRSATAVSRISMSCEAAQAIRDNSLAKGDALSVARIAAIQAVKATPFLIPLCHPLQIDGITVNAQWISENVLEWQVTVRSTGKTGVEIEALTSASIAALTLYDMAKSVDKSMEILSIHLVEKTGGIRGDFRRNE